MSRTSKDPDRKVTISDVAREAKVSTATVSRVLNKQHSGAPDVRRSVLDAARSLGFEPNSAARQLAGGRGQNTSVGFVLKSFEPLTGYYGDILNGAEAEARRHGHNLYASTAAYSMAVLADGKLPRGMNGESVRGVIAGSLSDEFYASCREAGLPLVLVNTRSAGTPCDCVLCDNLAASYRAVRMLIDLGHRRIACIACEYPRNVTVWERVMGYRQALAEAGLPVDPALLEEQAGFTQSDGEDAMGRLASKGAAPTAVFGTADEVAVGAIHWARAAGVRVPEELSVVGVNDLEMARRCDPPLTTIRIFREEMGRAAVQRLRELWENPDQSPRRIDVLCELVVRDSCAPAPERPSRVLEGGSRDRAHRRVKP